MSAKFILRNQEYEVRAGQSIFQVLQEMDIEPESIMAIRNGVVVPADTVLRENDVIQLVRIISGGSTNPNVL